MMMPTRTWDAESSYRFGFNNQERVDEISGKGNHNTALFWEYDTRLGRRWNLDPKPQVFISDYAAFENNPILITDILGDKVDYKKFGDRVRVGLKRLTNKDFRADFNVKKANQDMTFVYGKDKLAIAKLADAKPRFSAPEFHYKNDTPISNIKYNTPGVSVESSKTTINLGQKVVSENYNMVFDETGNANTTIILPNVVPNTEIGIKANPYPDNFNVNDGQGVNLFSGSIVDAGSGYLNVDFYTNRQKFNSGNGGSVSIEASSTMPWPHLDPNRGRRIDSNFNVKYTKFKTLSLPMIRLSIK